MDLYLNSLLENLQRVATESPQRLAIVETFGRTITYGDLLAQVDRVAGNLAVAGFARGDRALLLIRPGIDLMVSMLAVMRAGGVLVAADIAMGQEAFESRVHLANPRWLFAESVFLMLQKLPAARRLLRSRRIEIPELVGLSSALVVRAGPSIPGISANCSLSQLRRRDAPPHVDVALAPDDDAAIIFTSGTTALPKAVVHTQTSLDAMLRMVVQLLTVDSTDVLYGATLQVIAPALFGGCTLVLPRLNASARTTVAHLHRYKVTRCAGTPAEYEEVARYCAGRDQTLPPTLRTIILGSAPVPASFLERLDPVVPPTANVLCVYGLTEILPVATVSHSDKIAFRGEGDLIGRPLPGIKTRVAEDGELVVTGPNLFHRYLSGPPASEAFTGDLAEIESDGMVVLKGRKKDMIIRGNYNIYPGMIEPTIQRVPGVRDCCLIGVYDEARSDERVYLVVEKDDGRRDADFRRFLESQLLSGPFSIDQYALPDEIVLATIPRSGRSNKVDREALRCLIAPRTTRSL